VLKEKKLLQQKHVSYRYEYIRFTPQAQKKLHVRENIIIKKRLKKSYGTLCGGREEVEYVF
jgi:hypothetical protein